MSQLIPPIHQINIIIVRYYNLSNANFLLEPKGDAGTSRSGANYDVCAVVDQIVSALQASLGQQGVPPEQTGVIRRMVNSLASYKGLHNLLTGLEPQHMAHGAAPGYIYARLRSLAASSCLQPFTHNGGMPWAGQPWTSELPNDAALLLHVLAAYLAHPYWNFTASHNVPAASGGPLYVGTIPGRPAAHFLAILGTRPEPASRQGMSGIVAHDLSSHKPQFELLLKGQEMVRLEGQHALFHVLLFFLQYVKLELGGVLGGYHLDALQLERVLAGWHKPYGVGGAGS